MITINPFSELSEFIPSIAMQAYVIAMVILVAGGTMLDMAHKQSAKYFFRNSEKAKKLATNPVSAGEKASIALRTVAEDVLTSAEFLQHKEKNCTPSYNVWFRIVCHHFGYYDFLLCFNNSYYTFDSANIVAYWVHLCCVLVVIGFWFFYSC